MVAPPGVEGAVKVTVFPGTTLSSVSFTTTLARPARPFTAALAGADTRAMVWRAAGVAVVLAVAASGPAIVAVTERAPVVLNTTGNVPVPAASAAPPGSTVAGSFEVKATGAFEPVATLPKASSAVIA